MCTRRHHLDTMSCPKNAEHSSHNVPTTRYNTVLHMTHMRFMALEKLQRNLCNEATDINFYTVKPHMNFTHWRCKHPA